MQDELEPKPSHEIELEKLKIELERRRIDENLHKGWQEVASNIVGAIERSWKYGKEAESRFSRNILFLILGLLIGVGLLNFLGRVSGEVFTFFAGTMVGYLLSVAPLVRREKAS